MGKQSEGKRGRNAVYTMQCVGRRLQTIKATAKSKSKWVTALKHIKVASAK
jgi:hypothetical protein